jgi:hypothetical protein
MRKFIEKKQEMNICVDLRIMNQHHKTNPEKRKKKKEKKNQYHDVDMLSAINFLDN